MNAHRSGCPINLTLEALGDRWSLIVVRNLMFGNRRLFRRHSCRLSGPTERSQTTSLWLARDPPASDAPTAT
jgi:hypothetical protein